MFKFTLDSGFAKAYLYLPRKSLSIYISHYDDLCLILGPLEPGEPLMTDMCICDEDCHEHA